MTTERKPHPHIDVIRAWAEGEEIEYRRPEDIWRNVEGVDLYLQPRTEFRIKPKRLPPEPRTWYQVVYRGSDGRIWVSQRLVSDRQSAEQNFSKDILELIPVYTEE